MPSNGLTVLDIAGVSEAYRERVERACPELLPLAMRTLDRLPPRRWTLEWYLPWWLGSAFGLEPEISTGIVVSNVLGLASVRMADDLVDGEVDAAELAAARTLSAALYREAVAPYRVRFPASSPFWSHLDERMEEWRAELQDTERLSSRGAPLKISAYAVCLLTKRMDIFPILDRILDHALSALVLYDHVADWRGDLAAGRWNAFVAAASDEPQVPESMERHRARTLVSIMTEDAITNHFARITLEMRTASGLIGALASTPRERADLAPLATHLLSFAARAEDEGSALQSHYHDLATRARALLFRASGSSGISRKEAWVT